MRTRGPKLDLGQFASVLVPVAITIAVILGQTWWAVTQDKELTLAAEASNGLVAARLLEEHATQTLQDAANTLEQVSEIIRRAGKGDGKDDKLIRQIIDSYELRQTRHLKTLQFVNPAGQTWITAPDNTAHRTDVSERPYIRALLDRPTQKDVLIGHAYPSRYDSQLVIPVARNVFDDDDKRIGIVSVDLRLSYFGSVYARLAKDNNASVALIADEGFIFVRSPFEARYLDRDITEEQALQIIRSNAGEGTFSDDAFLDDEQPRLYAYRKITGFPITTVYGRDFVSILADWRIRTQGRILLTSLVLLLIVAFTAILMLQVRRLRLSRHSLRQSEYMFSGLFQSSPVPLALARSPGGQVIKVNDAWLTQFGFHIDEIVERTADELKMWVEIAQRDAFIDDIARTNSAGYRDVSLRRKDGGVLICMISAKRFIAGDERMLIAAALDVTRQRQMEGEIRDLNLELEQRVAARTETLEQTNNELSHALDSVKAMQNELIHSEKMAALGALVAGVAHELNTPIGNSVTVASTLDDATKTFVESVRNGALKRSVLEQYLGTMGEGITILMRTLSRAVELITSFKQVAVDQSSDMRRAFNLDTMLREISLTISPMYKSTNFKLVLDLAPEIECDSYPGALGQVVTNFVSNSLMHGFEGRSEGTMCIKTRAVSDTHFELIYSDDGVGISPENMARVFDPFFTTKFGRGGSGLGMHVVYNIVTDIFRGKLDMKSTPGAGTTITLTLPYKAPMQTKASSATKAAVPASAAPN